MTTLKTLSIAILLAFSQISLAAAVVKYSGTLEMTGAGPHRQGVKGSLNISFDGETLTQVQLKTEKPVFGQSEFNSKEQNVFSRVDGATAQMAFVFMFEGPPHAWRYVILTSTTDQGKNFVGNFYKVTGTVDEINAILSSGTIPSSWKSEGQISLAAAN